MITPSEDEHIRDRAYVPEHMTGYVMAISNAEPFLFQDYLWYLKERHLIFIGYPLSTPRDPGRLGDVLNRVVEDSKPRTMAVIAETPLLGQRACVCSEEDGYYRIALSGFGVPQKVGNVVRRAGRELRVKREEKKFGRAHQELVGTFLESHEVGEQMRSILEKIPDYVSSVPTARVYAARDSNGSLVAFDVAEFGARDYAFYMFNFRTPSAGTPGASDLLLHEIIKDAAAEGKRFVNLGLGISPGVVFFKRKWGAAPFLPYRHGLHSLYRPSLLDALPGRA